MSTIMKVLPALLLLVGLSWMPYAQAQDWGDATMHLTPTIDSAPALLYVNWVVTRSDGNKVIKRLADRSRLQLTNLYQGHYTVELSRNGKVVMASFYIYRGTNHAMVIDITRLRSGK
jgi:hypothetical protein